MKRSHRVAVAALCAPMLAVVPAQASAPDPGPLHSAAAHPAAAPARGFTWLNGGPSTLPAGGLRVYVIRTSHVSRLTTAVKRTVQQQHRYGVPVRWAGYTTRQRKRNAIVVYNDRHSPCGPNSAELGVGGFAERTSYSSSGTRIAWRGYARICPRAYRSNLLGVVLHEMGHAIGLGHYTERYRGRLQVMYPMVQPWHRYQAGDVDGLKAIAAHTLKRG